MMETPFNINHMVKVKLTDYGREMHKKNYVDFWKKLRTEPRYLYTPPEEDAEGWSKWQLWHLMEEFGQHLHFGSNDLPFDTNIVLND